MKKVIILSFIFSLYVAVSDAFVHYPCTIIIENKTEEPLSICLEYRLDQIYKNADSTKMPLVPNNKNYHFHTIAPGAKSVIPVLVLTPCSEEFCFLDTNLKTIGFTPSHKRIEGAVTLQNQKISYAFCHTVLDGQTITLQVEPNRLNSLFT